MHGDKNDRSVWRIDWNSSVLYLTVVFSQVTHQVRTSDKSIKTAAWDSGGESPPLSAFIHGSLVTQYEGAICIGESDWHSSVCQNCANQRVA